ncbi:hypothetical protein [Ancylobacter terrae]|uniref:hypothetical protein n=1 Tax=Ancylobacter sp. sgz301288 TaxID=3342077 RepID=UPI00385BEE39
MAPWLGLIRDLADIDLQRRRWGNDPSPHWSYIEFVCSYFDSTIYDDYYAYVLSVGFISSAEHRAVITFTEALSAHVSPTGNDYDNQAVLDDPKWHDVVRLAGEARDELRRLITDPAELRVLLEG